MDAKEAQSKLEAGIRSLTTSDDWKAALRTAAAFHNYSFGNTLLIQMQRPDATRVAGFRAWNHLGRHVRKGEKGLVILAPLLTKVRLEGDQEATRLRGFRPAHVFDVGQTEGEDLPPDPTSFVHRLKGGGDCERRLFMALSDLLCRQGWDAGRSAMDGHSDSTMGYTDFTKRTVHVRATVSDAQALKTMLHEYTHVLLHDPIGYLANRPLCEAEAESAAYIAAQVLELDTAEYSFGYVASWSGGKFETVQTAGKRALAAAKEILQLLGVEDEKDEAA